MRLGITMIIVAFNASSVAVASDQAPPEHRPIPSGYEIAASYDPDARLFHATSIVQFVASPQTAKIVDFVLHSELRVKSVKLGSEDLKCDEKRIFYEENYSVVANQVTCPVEGKSLGAGLAVEYEGPFNPSWSRWPSDYYRGDADGLYLRGPINSLWFPYFSDEKQAETIAPPIHASLTAPAGFTSIMNGQHLRHSELNGKAIDEWQATGFKYLELQYTARPFAKFEAPGLIAYGLKDEASLAAGRKVAELGAELTRRYARAYRSNVAPGQSFYVLQLPKFGQISSGNVSGMTEEEWREFSPMSPSARTLSHELVHPYVQLATPRTDPLFAVAIEGMPSYFDLPILGDLRGDDYYEQRMDRAQTRWFERLKPDYTDWDGKLPPLKPLTKITDDEVGIYKDRFLLADRALLFFDYMRRIMGREKFDAWAKDITNAPRMTLADFYASLGKHAPALQLDAHLWLETTQYPERFQRKISQPGKS